MADPNKKSQELQRKFDQIMADLREQDEQLANAYAVAGVDPAELDEAGIAADMLAAISRRSASAKLKPIAHRAQPVGTFVVRG